MTLPDSTWNRLALLTALAKGKPGLGRTAMMKLPFFLATLRNVPMDYDFRLYTYGPFDSNVLGDLSYAESLGAVKSKLVLNPRGYGYEIEAGENADDIEARGSEFLRRHRESIEWVLREFGDLTAAMLELLSTLVYVDREAKSRGENLSIDELTVQVHEVKPHFDKATIRAKAESLQQKGLLLSVA